MFCKTMDFSFYMMGIIPATYCLNTPINIMQSKYIPHLKLVSELVVLYCLTSQTSRCCPDYKALYNEADALEPFNNQAPAVIFMMPAQLRAQAEIKTKYQPLQFSVCNGFRPH